MRSLVLSLALCALAPLLPADTIPVPATALQPNEPLGPAPTSFTDSTAAVTADPRFTFKEYMNKWPHISLDEAKRVHSLPDVVFVDGRGYNEWEVDHISGAVPLPVGEFDKRYPQYKKKLRKAKMLVSYCHGEHCRASDALAQKLTDMGHKNVAVFWGGYPAWHDAKLPLVDKDGKAVGEAASAETKAPAPKPAKKKKKADSMVNPGSGPAAYSDTK